MAVQIRGAIVLPADRQTVWAKLNDPDVLKACIPGVQSLEQTGDVTFRAVARMKIGLVSATFKGRVELSNIDPPNAYRISGAGEGGLAGFASGDADVVLSEVPEGTRLSYDVRASLGGKLARLGARLVGGAAQGVADRFFVRLAAEIVK